jgi:hypothetical protein
MYLIQITDSLTKESFAFKLHEPDRKLQIGLMYKIVHLNKTEFPD